MSDRKKPTVSEIKTWWEEYEQWAHSQDGWEEIFRRDADYADRSAAAIPYLLDLVERMGKALERFVAEHSTRTAATPETHMSGYYCDCVWCKEARALLEEIEK